MDKVSYALGMGIGSQLCDMGAKELNIDDFAQAIKDVIAGNKQLGDEEAQQIVQKFFMEQEQKQRAAAAERFKANKEEGEKYLAENAKKEGVVVLPSGLQYKVLTEGKGKKAGAADKVRCDYEGRFINGNVFDSSYKRGVPAEFGVNQVIKGWTEALQLMPEGSKWELYIPYDLAYGETGAQGAIPPYATLIFTVEVIAVL